MTATLSRRAFLQLCLASLAAGVLPGCRQKPSPPKPTGIPSTATPVPRPAATPTVVSPTRVSLPGTETWNIASKIVGQEYQIFINFPASYGAGNRFPVLYLMDGNGAFPLARAIYGELISESKIPDTLIVGVGYPTEDGTLIHDLRGRDFTPYPDTSTIYESPAQNYPRGTGGAPQFLRFIREELKPAIDARYATFAGEATLSGHSLGGLFTLYAIFEGGGLFKRFVAGSPSIWWAGAAIYGAEKNYADSHTDLAARLFMGAGSDEGSMVTDVNTMADKLRQCQYPGFHLTTQIFDNEGHVSVIPFCISRGLQAVNE